MPRRPEQPAIHPAALLLVGIVGSVFWLSFFQALAWLLPRADTLISRVMP